MNQNVNIPLLRKATEWVEEQAVKPVEDRQWEQADWVLDEAHVAHHRDLARWYEKQGREVPSTVLRQATPRSCGTAYCVAGYIDQVLLGNTGDMRGDIADRAKKALGLTEDEADMLFLASNSPEDIRQIAEEIAGERL